MPTILLIDDSKTIRQAAQMALAKNTELNLVTLEDGNFALEKARELSPDLIVIDHALAPKNGYDLAKDLKNDATLKKIPIMLLVGPHVQLDPQKAMTIGITGAVSKPFTVEHFVASLQEGLGAGITSTVPALESTPIMPPPAISEPVPPPTLAPSPTPSPSEPLSHLKPPPLLPNTQQEAISLNSVSRETLENTIRKIIEEVVWEVVPELAESIIREELSRLMKK